MRFEYLTFYEDYQDGPSGLDYDYRGKCLLVTLSLHRGKNLTRIGRVARDLKFPITSSNFHPRVLHLVTSSPKEPAAITWVYFILNFSSRTFDNWYFVASESSFVRYTFFEYILPFDYSKKIIQQAIGQNHELLVRNIFAECIIRWEENDR